MVFITNHGVSSHSSSPGTRLWTYDVFLSFRGEDTRTNFTDHLYHALIRRGISTFIDEELTRGEEISPALLKAIEESRISIIIFSENYASSRWCLDELVKILQCKKSNQQMVFPVFYKVDPSHVGNQTCTFGDAFAEHDRKFKDNMKKVLEWRGALSEAANLSGWHLEEGEYEYKFISEIVENLWVQVLNRTYLHVAKYPIGILSCVRDVDAMLDVGGNRCCMLGIWGTAGIGKTTIAKAVFNSIAHKFEGRCFLENVRDSMSNGGLLQLQNKLLGEILGDKNLNVNSVDRGIGVIQQRLGRKMVLIILDDVNQLDQLNKLAGAESWFGEGSRVIITTTDRGLLTRHGIELIYKVGKLDYQQALELFSLNAFEMNTPPDDYLELSEHAIAYAQHLPLALTLLGSHLRNKSMERWRATLDFYEGHPYESIQRILRISYNALAYRVQQVFLDIACFFKGQNKDYVIQILQCNNLNNPDDCIQELVEKAIISIEHDRILMHGLLEQMGKDIVFEESPTEPGERSRLWFHEDVRHVLKENTGTNKVKGIMIKLPEPDELHLTAKSFSGMTNLGIFINRNASICGEVGFFPNKLRLIDWGNCELQSLPSNLLLNELVVLNMPSSRIRQLGEPKNLSKLTSLNLRGCQFLTKISDLSGSPNLKYLDLFGCTSLFEVDASVGFLPKLLSLDLEGCDNLTIFPTRISLKSLKTLRLNGCKSLKIFPEIEDKMEFITELTLNGSGIRELPWSISYLTQLEEFSAYGCDNISIGSASTSQVNSSISQDKRSLLVLPKLLFLRMQECNSSKSDFLMDLDCSSTLRCLHLSGDNLVSLPAYITKFVNLEELFLCRCTKIQEIPELPPKVKAVYADNCRALENFPKLLSLFEHESESRGLELLHFVNCRRLCANNGYDLARIEFLLLNQHSNHFEIIVPGSEVPKWFNYRCDEGQNVILPSDILTCAVICEVSIKIPRNVEWEKSGLAVCVVFESTLGCSIHGKIRINGVHRPMYLHSMFISRTESAHVFLKYIPLAGTYKPHVDGRSSLQYDTCEIVFFCYSENSNGLDSVSVKGYGVHLVCHQIGDVMQEMNNDSDIGNDDEVEEQCPPLSTKPMNPQRKRPHGASDVTEIADTNHTYDSVDRDMDVDDSDAHEQWQWFSSSSEPMTPQTLDLLSFLRSPEASILMEVDGTNVNNHQDEWLSLSLGPTGIQKRTDGASTVMAFDDTDMCHGHPEANWLSSSLEPPSSLISPLELPSILMAVGDTSIVYDHQEAPLVFLSLERTSLPESPPGGTSVVMEVDDPSSDYDHQEAQWLSLSLGPTSLQKSPPKPSVAKTVDDTNSIDYDDQREVQWLSLSLEPMSLRKSPSVASLFMEVNDTNNTVHDRQERPTFSDKRSFHDTKQSNLEHLHDLGDDNVIDCEVFTRPENNNYGASCELAVGTIGNIVAFGTIQEDEAVSKTIHGVPLKEGCVRVSVDGEIQSGALLPFPVKDIMETVGQSIGSHVAWPEELVIRRVSKKRERNAVAPKALFQTCEFVPKRCKLLYKYAKTIMTTNEVLIRTELEGSVFGYPRELFILTENVTDLLEMKCIGAGVIAAYMAHLHEILGQRDLVDTFGFVDPATTFKGYEMKVEKYIVDRLKEGKADRIFFVPHNPGGHWILTIIWEDEIYMLDSMPKPIHYVAWEKSVMNAVRTFNVETGRGKKQLKWKPLPGAPKQPGGHECGYYVMRYMKDIIDDETLRFSTKWASKTRKEYTQDQLDEVRIEVADYLQNLL